MIEDRNFKDKLKYFTNKLEILLMFMDMMQKNLVGGYGKPYNIHQGRPKIIEKQETDYNNK